MCTICSCPESSQIKLLNLVTETLFLLHLCSGSSKCSSLRLHPSGTRLLPLYFRNYVPAVKSYLVALCSILPKGASGYEEGMQHA